MPQYRRYLAGSCHGHGGSHRSGHNAVVLHGLGGALPTGAWLDLAEAGVPKTYRPGGVLLRQGDPGSQVLVLLSGRVKALRDEADGSQLLLAVRGPGEILGEMAVLDGTQRSATIIAIDRCMVRVVTGQDFMSRVHRHHLHSHVIRHVLGRLRENEDLRAELAALPASGRLTRTLIRLSAIAPTSSDDQAELKLTQEELARAIGVSRSAVALVLRELRMAGVITTARGRLVVRDIAALNRQADESADVSPSGQNPRRFSSIVVAHAARPAEEIPMNERQERRSRDLPEERAVVVVDTKDFTATPSAFQQALNRDVEQVVAKAFTRAGLAEEWEGRAFSDSTGDGYIAGIPKSKLPTLIDPFIDLLQDVLAEHDRTLRERDRDLRMRMRVSIHVGPLPDSGIGKPMNDTHRLLDSVPVRAALSETSPDVTFVAAVVSHTAFNEAVVGRYTGLRPEQFQPVIAELPHKGFAESAHLYVPRPSYPRGEPESSDVPKPLTDPGGPPPSGGNRFDFSGTSHGQVIQAGQIGDVTYGGGTAGDQ